MGELFYNSGDSTNQPNIAPEQNALVYWLSQYYGRQIGAKPSEYGDLGDVLSGKSDAVNNAASNYYNNALLGPSMRTFNKTTRPQIESAFAGYGATLSSRRGKTISDAAGDVTANAQAGLANFLPQLMNQQIQGLNTKANLGFALTQQASQFATTPTLGGSRQAGGSTGLAEGLATMLPLLLGLSDKRAKKNVKPIKGALNKVLALKGIEYEYKDPKIPGALPGRQVGIMAQDLEAVLPDMVFNGPDGLKRINTRGFEGVLVEALRELSTKVDRLEGVVA